MFSKQINLTTALRPSLHSGEALLFVQDGVGLYEGYELIQASVLQFLRLTGKKGNTRSPTASKAMHTSLRHVYVMLTRATLEKALLLLTFERLKE